MEFQTNVPASVNQTGLGTVLARAISLLVVGP